MRARLHVLILAVVALDYSGQCWGADAVPLRAGQVAPFSGVLTSVQAARGVRAKLLALVELRAAVDARSRQVSALTSAVALHEAMELRYKTEADRAVRAATAQRLKNRADRTKGIITGISIGALLSKVIGLLF